METFADWRKKQGSSLPQTSEGVALSAEMTHQPNSFAGRRSPVGEVQDYMARNTHNREPGLDPLQKGIDSWKDITGAALAFLPGSDLVEAGKEWDTATKAFAGGEYGKGARHTALAAGNAALELTGPVGDAAKLASGKGLAMLLGAGAKKASPSMLGEAKYLASRGDYPDLDIWRRTGWYKDVDDEWKFEISDHNANLTRAAKEDTIPGTTLPLSEVLEHKELYDNYPELKNLPVKYLDLGDDFGGRHVSGKKGDPGYVEINAYLNDDDQKSVLFHEIEHWVQAREGFGYGMSVEQAKTYATKVLNNAYDVKTMQLYHDQHELNRAEYFALDGYMEYARNLEKINKVPDDPRVLKTLPIWRKYRSGFEADNGKYEDLEPGSPEAKAWLMKAKNVLSALAPKQVEYGLAMRGKNVNNRFQQLLKEGPSLEQARLYYEYAMNDYDRFMQTNAYKQLLEYNNKKLVLSKLSDYEAYKRFAGEVEARNVQRRARDMTPSEAAEIMPTNSTEYDANQQYVLKYPPIEPTER